MHNDCIVMSCPRHRTQLVACSHEQLEPHHSLHVRCDSFEAALLFGSIPYTDTSLLIIELVVITSTLKQKQTGCSLPLSLCTCEDVRVCQHGRGALISRVEGCTKRTISDCGCCQVVTELLSGSCRVLAALLSGCSSDGFVYHFSSHPDLALIIYKHVTADPHPPTHIPFLFLLPTDTPSHRVIFSPAVSSQTRIWDSMHPGAAMKASICKTRIIPSIESEHLVTGRIPPSFQRRQAGGNWSELCT